jgi:hypothetical protein
MNYSENNVRSPTAKVRTNECFYGNEQKFWQYIQNNKSLFKTLSFIWTIQTKCSFLQDIEKVRNIKKFTYLINIDIVWCAKK